MARKNTKSPVAAAAVETPAAVETTPVAQEPAVKKTTRRVKKSAPVAAAPAVETAPVVETQPAVETQAAPVETQAVVNETQAVEQVAPTQPVETPAAKPETMADLDAKEKAAAAAAKKTPAHILAKEGARGKARRILRRDPAGIDEAVHALAVQTLLAGGWSTDEAKRIAADLAARIEMGKVRLPKKAGTVTLPTPEQVAAAQARRAAARTALAAKVAVDSTPAAPAAPATPEAAAAAAAAAALAPAPGQFVVVDEVEGTATVAGTPAV